MTRKFLSIIFLLLTATGIAFFSSCSRKTQEKTNYSIFGDSSVTDADAAAASSLPQLLADKDSIACKLQGEIEAVCQMKGCWMTMPINEEESLHIKFKDYGFFVPKNADGKRAIIDGIAFVDTVSIAELRHRAEDAGESKEEVESIDRESVEYTFVARAVLIK